MCCPRPQLLKKPFFQNLPIYVGGTNPPKVRSTNRAFPLNHCVKNGHFKLECVAPGHSFSKNPFFQNLPIYIGRINPPKVRSTNRPFALNHCVKNGHFKLECVAPSHRFEKTLFFIICPYRSGEPTPQIYVHARARELYRAHTRGLPFKHTINKAQQLHQGLATPGLLTLLTMHYPPPPPPRS